MKKYIILEQHKWGTSFKDSWSVKFSDLDTDKAFAKMVALDTLNDNKDILITNSKGLRFSSDVSKSSENLNRTQKAYAMKLLTFAEIALGKAT